MNTLRDRNTFTVKADVIFHAANHDPSGQSIIPEGNDDDCIPRAAVLDTGTPQGHHALCQQRSWDTVEFGSLTETGSLGCGLAAGNSLQDGSSSDSGFQEHPQSVGGAKAEMLDLVVGHPNEAFSKNGIKECSSGNEVSCSLDASLKTRLDTAEETEATKSLSDVRNKETRRLEQALGHFLGSDTERRGGVGSPYGATHGQSAPGLAQVVKHSGNGLGSTPSLREQPDLVIEVGGRKIQAHKCVLAEKSDYFKARLSRDILKVKGVNYKTLTVLIDYVYSSKMDVNKENVVDVITGAKILQMPCAVQAAVDGVSSQLTSENCYEILAIAKKQRLNTLKETAYRFMSDNFLQVLRDPAVYGRLTGAERDLVLRKRMEGGACLMAAEIEDVFERAGSRPPSRSNSRPQSPLLGASLEDSHVIYCYSEAARDWRTLTVMPEDVSTKGCGICCMYNYLFVAGGIRGCSEKAKASDRVFCYNPVTDRWSEVRPMSQARAQLKLVSADGCLYAVGGECLFTVERYDPRADRWTAVAALPKGAFAVAHEATACNGELYVSGGSLFYRLLKYDPKRDEWQECPYNNSRRKSADMVALRNFIYRFDVGRELGVGVFKYNTIVKMWHDCAAQRQGSSLPFRCAVLGNCIYCVNKNQTLKFVVEEDGARFAEEPLKAPQDAKGVLFPFVLNLPDRGDRNV
ncbi:kelch repeat and BTB domain-containing protein 11 [Electrophorus electricus]|uniref:kelch repeat and BTB domain-containing protein 11 n=1 Tax=Electrophorus electricus TaxID=8005 RepID=UPI0015CFDD6E|nr:kelch repeat and BTB domain-containing protein 11 [Electrophorus electricus]